MRDAVGRRGLRQADIVDIWGAAEHRSHCWRHHPGARRFRAVFGFALLVHRSSRRRRRAERQYRLRATCHVDHGVDAVTRTAGFFVSKALPSMSWLLPNENSIPLDDCNWPFRMRLTPHELGCPQALHTSKLPTPQVSLLTRANAPCPEAKRKVVKRSKSAGQASRGSDAKNLSNGPRAGRRLLFEDAAFGISGCQPRAARW